jgi:signal transduction histidine kinase
VVAVIVRTPAGARIDWSIDIPHEVCGRIGPDDLAEAIGNLVENAARHAHGHVAVRCRRRADLMVITVADDGPGIPPERLDEALARGGQLDRTGGGAGLGLAIVGDIAEAWGGRLDIRNSTTGLEADFCVPASDPTPGERSTDTARHPAAHR